MKKFSLLFILFFTFTYFLFAQSWQWAQHFGSINNDTGGQICLDDSNNLYLTGNYFPPYATFGSNSIASVGINDLFILKIDNNGNYIWSERAGGNNTTTTESSSDILFESTSNTLVIVGRMDGSNEIFDSCHLGNGIKIFLSKLDLSGNCIWSISQGLNSNSIGTKICADGIGNIYMYGLLQYTSIFNGNIFPAGGFLAKFNSSDGACIWVKNIFNNNNLPNSIEYYNNSIYLSGICMDTLHIDSATTIGNYYDIFYSKFDTAGTVQWAKTVGGPNEDYGGAIKLDMDGYIYLTGTFKDTIYLDTIMLSNGLNRDWFISKFDNNGNVIWAEQIRADSASGSSSIVDNDGNIYVSGSFSGNAAFGNYTLTSTENSELFVAKYDSSGMCLGAYQVNKAHYASIVCDSNNDFYVCGGFTDTSNFDGHSIISYGATDVFIAKHDAITGDPELRKASNALTIYANPTTGKCNISIPDEFKHEKNLKLTIFDNTGKLIQQGNVEMNEEKVRVNLQAEAKGIYNVTLSNGKKSYGGKIVFE